MRTKLFQKSSPLWWVLAWAWEGRWINISDQWICIWNLLSVSPVFWRLWKSDLFSANAFIEWEGTKWSADLICWGPHRMLFALRIWAVRGGLLKAEPPSPWVTLGRHRDCAICGWRLGHRYSSLRPSPLRSAWPPRLCSLVASAWIFKGDSFLQWSSYEDGFKVDLNS